MNVDHKGFPKFPRPTCLADDLAIVDTRERVAIEGELVGSGRQDA